MHTVRHLYKQIIKKRPICFGRRFGNANEIEPVRNLMRWIQEKAKKSNTKPTMIRAGHGADWIRNEAGFETFKEKLWQSSFCESSK